SSPSSASASAASSAAIIEIITIIGIIIIVGITIGIDGHYWSLIAQLYLFPLTLVTLCGSILISNHALFRATLPSSTDGSRLEQSCFSLINTRGRSVAE